MVKCWVILQKNPHYNDYDSWIWKSNPIYVVVGSNATVQTRVDALNEQVQTYVQALREKKASIHNREMLKENMRRKPPYEEMVAAIGPKPRYDHSMEKDKEYNIAHVSRVAAWRQEFHDWAQRNSGAWDKRLNELVDAEIKEVSTDILGQDLFDIAANTHDSTRYGYTRYAAPEFSYVEVPLVYS